MLYWANPPVKRETMILRISRLNLFPRLISCAVCVAIASANITPNVKTLFNQCKQIVIFVYIRLLFNDVYIYSKKTISWNCINTFPNIWATWCRNIQHMNQCSISCKLLLENQFKSFKMFLADICSHHIQSDHVRIKNAIQNECECKMQNCHSITMLQLCSIFIRRKRFRTLHKCRLTCPSIPCFHYVTSLIWC